MLQKGSQSVRMVTLKVNISYFIYCFSFLEDNWLSKIKAKYYEIYNISRNRQ